MTSFSRRAFLAASACAPIARPRAEPSLGDKLAADRHRPRYHLLPPAHWMNDPNGPIFWKGKYHVFYQHNPNGAFWGTMHWGHAVSEDLVHWKHLPIALAPTPGPDEDGCFTGCAVDNNGVPTFVYTGVDPEVQCIATSDDGLIAWKKHPGNPVIAGPPAGLQVTGFRDPCVWREDGLWYMLIGSGFKAKGGTALLYRSRNLVAWDYLHPLFVGEMDRESKGKDPVATGEMWECPDFFPLGDKHVLIVSTRGTVRYFVGRYAGHKFHMEAESSVDGGAYYAPKSFLDGRGRRILWGWIRETRGDKEQRSAGWSGVFSLPRVLSLGPDGRLLQQPAPELEKLRGARQHRVNLPVPQSGFPLLEGSSREALEFLAEIEPRGAVTLALTASPGERFFCAKIHPRKPFRLRVFVDGSVIEAFGNETVCATGRSYPVRPLDLQLVLHAPGEGAVVRTLDVWPMRPISKDRLTS